MYFVYVLMRWLPVIFFPLLAAQAYSTWDHINLRELFTGDLKPIDPSNSQPWMLNLSYPYFGLCLLAASAANTDAFSFYGGMVGLLAWALWFVRPRRSSPVLWICLLLIATGTGYVGQFGLHQLHLTVEQQVVNWLSNWNGQGSDPLEKTTNIGDIGFLKRSNAIVFRVSSKNQQKFPLRLREMTYNKFQLASWLAISSHFTPVPAALNGTSWQLGNPVANSGAISITATLDQGKGYLPLPDGTFQIDQLAAAQLERNQYGTVKLQTRTNDITYQLRFAQGISLDSPPTEADLQIPALERPALETVLQQLDLREKSPPDILKQIDAFFQTNFTYSLNLSRPDQSTTPLSAFLLFHRSGHCEYFATATTLLLRAAGIPARYATGYSVHEFSPWENQYIVRNRNAHAWAMVYLNGHWQAFDTTPSSWTSLEDGAASPWQALADLWSLASFKIVSGLHQLQQMIGLNQWWWLMIPLALILIRQFGRTKRVKRFTPPRIAAREIAHNSAMGNDSAFYLIEQTLTASGLGRYPYESLKAWIKRIGEALSVSQIADLQAIVELHYRYRFDPQSADATIRTRLKVLSQTWLDHFHQSISSKPIT
ncbi:transglutaminase-like domain-containing protein [Neosynechococcus sphagnicola]|uniref:transglutaminase-like domain-containing protein n=1 Tax=Neosynechococcus sphagnicola TaxID=1501145 RepID=UPI00068B0E09|nr:transglutaminase-like domain-containing protein [Neosynechococcus sphagnicola]